MPYPTIFVATLWLSSAAFALGQSGNTAYQLANLTEDFRLLQEEIRSLRTEIESLQRENARLKNQIAAHKTELSSRLPSMVSGEQLDQALTRTIQQLEARDEALKNLIIAEITKQLDAINQSLAKDAKEKQRPDDFRTEFPENFPKKGVSYTVKAGDTLLDIASRLNSKADWIQNANNIASPRFLQVGESYFIPQEQSPPEIAVEQRMSEGNAP